MDQRVSVVTLPVDDLARAKSFYAALGWSPAVEPDDEVAFYQAGPLVFGLWNRRAMSAESGVEVPRGSTMLAYNVGSDNEVDELLAAAEQAGGAIARPAVRMPWGGWSGAFADPDGNQWEVAHNQFWRLGDDGSVTLPGR